jgi:hypothetical protein
MTEAVEPQKPKHPPELVVLWRREGDWKLIPDDRWRQAREDLQRFCEAGWASLAYSLRWTPSGLYGVQAAMRDGKLTIIHIGIVGRLKGGSVLAIDTCSVLYRHHSSKKTVAFRKPGEQVIAAA